MAEQRLKKHMSMSSKNALSNTIIYILLVIMSVVWLLPFVFITFESFRLLQYLLLFSKQYLFYQ